MKFKDHTIERRCILVCFLISWMATSFLAYLIMSGMWGGFPWSLKNVAMLLIESLIPGIMLGLLLGIFVRDIFLGGSHRQRVYKKLRKTIDHEALRSECESEFQRARGDRNSFDEDDPFVPPSLVTYSPRKTRSFPTRIYFLWGGRFVHSGLCVFSDEIPEDSARSILFRHRSDVIEYLGYCVWYFDCDKSPLACSSCGYDMRTNEKQCPECGMNFE